jgi:hypothetical protein
VRYLLSSAFWNEQIPPAPDDFATVKPVAVETAADVTIEQAALASPPEFGAAASVAPATGIDAGAAAAAEPEAGVTAAEGAPAADPEHAARTAASEMIRMASRA